MGSLHWVIIPCNEIQKIQICYRVIHAKVVRQSFFPVSVSWTQRGVWDSSKQGQPLADHNFLCGVACYKRDVSDRVEES